MEFLAIANRKTLLLRSLDNLTTRHLSSAFEFGHRVQSDTHYNIFSICLSTEDNLAYRLTCRLAALIGQIHYTPRQRIACHTMHDCFASKRQGRRLLHVSSPGSTPESLRM